MPRMPSELYGMAAETRQRENASPRASFLGIPPEVRVYIYDLLFRGLVLRIWHTMFTMFMHKFATAIISTCRQASSEARPVLFSNLELRLEWHECWDIKKQIHPRVQELVLPYLRRLTFLQNGFGDILSVDSFRQWSPNLKVVDIGTKTFGISVSRTQMFDAAANKVRAWTTSARRTATEVSSFNRFLMTVTLKTYGIRDSLSDQYLHGAQSNFTWLRDLLDDKSRHFSVIGSVHGALIEEQGTDLNVVRIDLNVSVTFNLSTLSVLERRVHLTAWAGNWMTVQDLVTVQDARAWAFRGGHISSESETAEQSELEGRKLLADLRDSS